MNNEELEMQDSFDIDQGDENTFFIADDGNIFGIAFDKLFNQPQLKVYDTFELRSKRSFRNLSPIILDTYNELFLDESGSLIEDCELVFFNILKVKSDIEIAAANNQNTSYNKFIEHIDTILNGGDKLLYHIIDNFVETNYSLTLDKITQQTKEKKRRVNQELQFEDTHAKELLKIAYLYRVMMPIIGVYFFYNKGTFASSKTEKMTAIDAMWYDEDTEEMEFDDANSSIFAYLFDQFASNPNALRNKLYVLTRSGVSKTSFSDKRFWTIVKNLAITEKSETLEIYKKLLTNAIPKLSIDGDKNIVSFLHAVINNQVDFIFQNKFKYRFVPVGANEIVYSTEDADENNMSEFERMEILQSRKDEGSYMLRKMNIKDMVPKISERLGVGVSDAEVKDAMGKIKRNAIQEQIIAFLTFKYFGDKDALKYVDFYQYCFGLMYILNIL